jgi:hypothetical protein
VEQRDHDGWYVLWLGLDLSSDIRLPVWIQDTKSFAVIPIKGMPLIVAVLSFRCTNSKYRIDVQPATNISSFRENTGGIFALDQAHSWLNTCIERHQYCNAYYQIIKSKQDQSRPFRPTRLLEIRPDTIRLHLTENAIYHYAALSHRWPTNPGTLLRLTTANEADLMNVVPQSSSEGFSKVFLDAVKVCRRLDIEYLWIDSLCIIQDGDDGVDWNKESARMGDVYKHALCTIAAESIEDPDESLHKGMFRMHNKALLEPMVDDASFDLKVDTSSGSIFKWKSKEAKSPKPGQYYLMPTNGWLVDISKSPLSRRGWVEQERILAPRILHFTSKQIYFDCHQTMANEVWPNGHPTYDKRWIARPWTVLQDLALHKAAILQEIDMTPRTKNVVENPLSVWFRIAYAYARTDLTMPKDKLVAISGLARELQSYLGATPSDYLAGIWVQSLPYGLLWYVPLFGRPEKTRVRSQDHYQAPSWSWASINWALSTDERFHREPHDILVSLDSFDITSKSDPFGEVESGARIVLRGLSIPGSVSWARAETNYSSESKFWPSFYSGGRRLLNSDQNTVCPDERYVEGESRNRNDLKLLPILRSKGSSYTTRWAIGLVLEPTAEKGVYRRFGYLWSRPWRMHINVKDSQRGKEVFTII